MNGSYVQTLLYTTPLGATILYDIMVIDSTHVALLGDFYGSMEVHVFVIDGSWNLTYLTSRQLRASTSPCQWSKIDSTHFVVTGNVSPTTYVMTVIINNDYTFTVLDTKSYSDPTYNYFTAVCSVGTSRVAAMSDCTLITYTLDGSYHMSVESTIHFAHAYPRSLSVLAIDNTHIIVTRTLPSSGILVGETYLVDGLQLISQATLITDPLTDKSERLSFLGSGRYSLSTRNYTYQNDYDKISDFIVTPEYVVAKLSESVVQASVYGYPVPIDGTHFLFMAYNFDTKELVSRVYSVPVLTQYAVSIPTLLGSRITLTTSITQMVYIDTLLGIKLLSVSLYLEDTTYLTDVTVMFRLPIQKIVNKKPVLLLGTSVKKVFQTNKTVRTTLGLKPISLKRIAKTISAAIGNSMNWLVSLEKDLATQIGTLVTLALKQGRLLRGIISLFGRKDLIVPLYGEANLMIPLIGATDHVINLLGGIDMSRKDQNFDMHSGDDKKLRFTITDETSITGATAIFMVKAGETESFRKTSSSGITVIAPNIIEVPILPADTAALSGDYFFEVQMTDLFGYVSTVSTGKMTVIADIIE